VTAFQPDLTPMAMMSMGVFGGSYFHNATDEDFEGMSWEVEQWARRQTDPFNKRCNAYEVKAGQSFAKWSKAGWLFPEDPLGWFQWYCRYHSGRRHERDDHQISRWERFGPYWKRYALAQIAERGDFSPVVKQSFVQWGYKPEEYVAL
jgi:hypothetical protein